MNRVLSFLTSRCPCTAARESLDRLKTECERIEAAAEETIEFCVPSLTTYLDGERTIRVFISAEPDEATIGDDLTTFAIMQLRAMSRELTTAADRLEGGVV